MSIMPPAPDSNKTRPLATLRGVGQMMQTCPDPLMVEVGQLIEYIGHQHEPPVVCDECRDENHDASYPCLMRECATGIAFRWLMDVANGAR